MELALPIDNSKSVGGLGTGGVAAAIGPKGFLVPVTCVLTGWGLNSDAFVDDVSGVDAGRTGLSFGPVDPKNEGLGAVKAEADDGPCDCEKGEAPVID